LNLTLSQDRPKPLISVCLPNLNNRAYLPERLESILGQTCRDWELVVVDSHSDDGAWELLNEYAARESRIRLHQMERAGIYAAFNRCVELAQGEYIYFATSDDTMEPECLEVLVRLLEKHPACGLAQCGLEIIDAAGRPVSETKVERPWNQTRFCRVLDKWKDREHVRRAPCDAFLHLCVYTAYKSVTQLLIRRNFFQQVGPFPSCYGSGGDFYWEMKAACLSDVAYTPRVLASWRVHSGQATQTTDAVANRWAFARIVQDVLSDLQRSGRGNLARRLRRFRYAQRYAEELVPMAAQFSRLAAWGWWIRLGWRSPRWMKRTWRLCTGSPTDAFDPALIDRALLQAGVWPPQAIESIDG
jgi:glycosyltransferase involved in cell wall biosynthesis